MSDTKCDREREQHRREGDRLEVQCQNEGFGYVNTKTKKVKKMGLRRHPLKILMVRPFTYRCHKGRPDPHQCKMDGG